MMIPTPAGPSLAFCEDTGAHAITADKLDDGAHALTAKAVDATALATASSFRDDDPLGGPPGDPTTYGEDRTP